MSRTYVSDISPGADSASPVRNMSEREKAAVPHPDRIRGRHGLVTVHQDLWESSVSTWERVLILTMMLLSSILDGDMSAISPRGLP